MLADMTLSRLGWAFNLWGPDANGVWAFGGGIIWVIGAAMVLLAGLVFLPTSTVATFGVAERIVQTFLHEPVDAGLHVHWHIKPQIGEVVAHNNPGPFFMVADRKL